jgi:hypothetical protein
MRCLDVFIDGLELIGRLYVVANFSGVSIAFDARWRVQTGL